MIDHSSPLRMPPERLREGRAGQFPRYQVGHRLTLKELPQLPNPEHFPKANCLTAIGRYA